MKRQQLRKDLVQITEWVVRVEQDIDDRITGKVDTDDEYTQVTSEYIVNVLLFCSYTRLECHSVL